MPIFLFTTEHYDWDDYKGLVVRADTKEQAIEFVNNTRNMPWISEWKCEEIQPDGEPRIILTDHHTG